MKLTGREAIKYAEEHLDTADLFPQVDAALRRMSQWQSVESDLTEWIYPGWNRPYTAESVLKYAEWLEGHSEETELCDAIAAEFRAIVATEVQP